MGKLQEWFKRAGESLWVGIRRFPVTLACATVITIISLVLLHGEDTLLEVARQWLERSAMALGLGIPYSAAVQLLIERRKPAPWVAAALWTGLAALLALYLVFLLPQGNLDRMDVMMRYMAVLLAGVALTVTVSYFPRIQGDERFALKLLWRLFVTGVFTGILFGGVSLVLLMLEQLLAVNIGDKAYMDALISCYGLFAPSFFLAGVPRDRLAPMGEPSQPLIRILLGYIVFPLLTIYTAIIYAYFVRILIMWSWPSNMLVNMVLWYTAIGVLALYFMRSQSAENRWFGFFDRWYPRLTVLPILLMFVGIGIRIGAYGFTEPRYMVLALGVWVSCLTALAILRRPAKRPNIVAPALLVALALITVLGPQNAFNVSRISQNARLDGLLARNGMLTAEGFIQPGADVPEKDRQEIYSILDYFDYNHDLSDVAALQTAPQDRDYTAILGFERPRYIDDFNKYRNFMADPESQRAPSVAGYDYLFINSYTKPFDGQMIAEDGLILSLEGEGGSNDFVVQRNGQVLYRKSINDFIKELDQRYVEGRMLTQQEMTFTDSNDQVAVLYILQDVSVDQYGSDEPQYYAGFFIALVDILE